MKTVFTSAELMEVALMCIGNSIIDDDKPRKGRYYCWTHCLDVEEADYAKHDRQGCDLQDMDFTDHD